MKKFIFLSSVLSLIILLSGCCLKHEWVEATCTTARTCQKCGKTEGFPLGHTWIPATCTEPMNCSVCGEIDGDPLGHLYDVNGSDFICSRCGEEKLFSYNEMDEVLYKIYADYETFYDTYVGKYMLMEIRATEASQNELVDSGFAGVFKTVLPEEFAEKNMPDIAVELSYAPENDDSFEEAADASYFDLLVVRAKLDKVRAGLFDRQYYVNFSDTKVISNMSN